MRIIANNGLTYDCLTLHRKSTQKNTYHDSALIPWYYIKGNIELSDIFVLVFSSSYYTATWDLVHLFCVEWLMQLLNGCVPACASGIPPLLACAACVVLATPVTVASIIATVTVRITIAFVMFSIYWYLASLHINIG